MVAIAKQIDASRPCHVGFLLLSLDENKDVKLFVKTSPPRDPEDDIKFLLIDDVHLHDCLEAACNQRFGHHEAAKQNLDVEFWAPTSDASAWGSWNTTITKAGFQLSGTEVGAMDGVTTPTILFTEFLNTLVDERCRFYDPGKTSVCIWYGDALFYAETGMEKLILDVCAAHPEIAARQIQVDMAARIAMSASGLPVVKTADERRRMRI